MQEANASARLHAWTPERHFPAVSPAWWARAALVSMDAAHGIFMELRAERALVGLDRRLDRLEENYLRVDDRG